MNRFDTTHATIARNVPDNSNEEVQQQWNDKVVQFFLRAGEVHTNSQSKNERESKN